MANKTKYRPEFAEKLVDHMRKGMSYQSFGAVCHATDKTMDTWCKKHEEFRDAKELGKIYERQFWEDMLAKGANGTLPKIKKSIARYDAKENLKGVLVIEEHAKVNATLVIFALKNKFPKEWRDKQEIELSNKDDDLSQMTPDEIKKRAEIYRQALNGSRADKKGT